MRMFSTVIRSLGLALMVAGLSGVALASDPLPTPEIDPGAMASALTLLSGGLLVLRGRRNK